MLGCGIQQQLNVKIQAVVGEAEILVVQDFLHQPTKRERFLPGVVRQHRDFALVFFFLSGVSSESKHSCVAVETYILT